MRRGYLLVLLSALLLLAVAVLAGGLWMKHFVVRRLQAEYGTLVLGISPGDVVPPGGQAIRAIPSSNPKMNLVVPVDLYPGARVVGVSVMTEYEPYTDGPLPTALIVMTSPDSEREILDYYLAAWQGHGAREDRRQLDSLVYRHIDPSIKERGVTILDKTSVMAFADTARGPALDTMDNKMFLKWLNGRSSLRLSRGTGTVTAIFLSVPLWGGKKPPEAGHI